MADFNEQQLEQLSRATGISMKELKRNLDSINSSAGSTTKSLNETTRSLNSLSSMSSSLSTAFRGVSSGATAFGTFAGVARSGADAIKGFSGKLGVAGKALGAAVGVVGEVAVVALEQYDSALATFQRISKSGIAGAEGIDELRKNMVEAGLPLEKFASMVSENNRALVGLTGSADKSAKAFGQMIGSMANTIDTDLRALGFAPEEIGETLSNFANLQRRLGQMQTIDQDKLTKGAVEFGKELDAVAKLTGQSRTEQQKTLDSAMREGRFLASQRKLQAQGPAGEKAATEIRNLMLGLSEISPVLAQGVKDIAGGFVNTQAAKQAFLSTGGEVTRVLESMKSGNMAYEDAGQKLMNGMKQQLPTVESFALAIGDSSNTFIPLHEMVGATTFAMGDLKKAIIENKKTQDAQINADADTTTKELVSAQKELLSAATNLQATALSFDTVSGALENSMIAMNKLSKTAYNTFGTYGDKETSSVMATNADISRKQLSIDLQAALAKRSDKVDQEAMFKSWGLKDDGLRGQLNKEISSLSNEIKELSTALSVAKVKASKETMTLGRMLASYLPGGSSGATVSGWSDSSELRDDTEKVTGMNASRALSTIEQDRIANLIQERPDLNGDNILIQIKLLFEEMRKERTENSQSSNINNNEETNKKLDSIVTALNQGNRNTQSIKQASQMG